MFSFGNAPLEATRPEEATSQPVENVPQNMFGSQEPEVTQTLKEEDK